MRRGGRCLHFTVNGHVCRLHRRPEEWTFSNDPHQSQATDSILDCHHLYADLSANSLSFLCCDKLWLWHMDHYGQQIIHYLYQVVLYHSDHEHKCAVSLRWYRPCSHNVFHHIQRGSCIDNLRRGQCKFHAHICLVCTRYHQEWGCSQTPNVLSTVHCCSVEDLCGSLDESRMTEWLSLCHQRWDLYPWLRFLCTAKTFVHQSLAKYSSLGFYCHEWFVSAELCA